MVHKSKMQLLFPIDIAWTSPTTPNACGILRGANMSLAEEYIHNQLKYLSDPQPFTGAYKTSVKIHRNNRCWRAHALFLASAQGG
jgi:hypothetical protein